MESVLLDKVGMLNDYDGGQRYRINPIIIPAPAMIRANVVAILVFDHLRWVSN